MPLSLLFYSPLSISVNTWLMMTTKPKHVAWLCEDEFSLLPSKRTVVFDCFCGSTNPFQQHSGTVCTRNQFFQFIFSNPLQQEYEILFRITLETWAAFLLNAFRYSDKLYTCTHTHTHTHTHTVRSFVLRLTFKKTFSSQTAPSLHTHHSYSQSIYEWNKNAVHN